MRIKGFFKASMKLFFWVFFQAPSKYDEMVDYCVNQLKEDDKKILVNEIYKPDKGVKYDDNS